MSDRERWSSARVVVGVLATLAACYRDGAPSSQPLANRPPPAEHRACSPIDDLGAEVLDVTPEGRLRSQSTGPLSSSPSATWGGPPVPAYVPRQSGSLELFLLDRADGGTFAFYRDPYGRNSCTLRDDLNCAYEARFYDGGGRLAWTLSLADVMSRGDHLEVQDIRLADGVVYFNEACQSYSSGAHGQCSSLVAVDPRAHRVLWRTPPLVSNGRFRIRGCYIVAGYGFTAEPDALFLVDRTTGHVVEKYPVSSAPQRLTLTGPNDLEVELYAGVTRRYRLAGFDTTAAALVSLDPPEHIYGGAGYGGAAYGGATYGGATYGRRPRP
jgi:hypothetical protein